ncbi:nuclear transport factor 2 family protein [Actinoplanes oblitus]|uniref:Nuclear transport factor 2 family protein n=1 Tax=Actinoplanes oblitus TaxID=3040509 RepID=A0ABY8WTT3_9ACTN|nr:nuclear transport factor 2 family protein [Actinoplanes oblitus]WIM99210.1 nuclear transport factor 2 family protein [Actinoplanes oblitus]
MSRADELAAAWVAFWNGDLSRAGTLLSSGFRIHFAGGNDAALAGDRVRGPAEMAAYVEDFREQRPGLRFTLDGPPVAGDAGFAIRWTAQRAGVHVGGIDLLHLAGDRIAEVWSVTGERPFPG